MAGDAAGKCPPWIDEFTDDVGECFKTGVVPVAFDVWGPDDMEGPEDLADPWVVHFYPSLSEMIGGPKDGAVVYPGISIDLLALMEFFDEIEEFRWGSRSREHEPRYDGAVLDLTGWYWGHPVWLRTFDAPPDDGTIDTVIEHRSGRLRIKDQPRG
jgi:hypothetical protein